jgi:hypothetical protein
MAGLGVFNYAAGCYFLESISERGRGESTRSKKAEGPWLWNASGRAAVVLFLTLSRVQRR